MRQCSGFVLLLLGIAMVVFGLAFDRSLAPTLIAELKAQPQLQSMVLLLGGGFLLGVVGFAMAFGSRKARRRDD